MHLEGKLNHMPFFLFFIYIIIDNTHRGQIKLHVIHKPIFM